MSEYKDAREAYWDAQREFRKVAINKIARLVPEGMSGAVFELGDGSPTRLTLMRYVRADDGQPMQLDEEELWDEIDQTASDMEIFSWDEADSILDEIGGAVGSQWLIERAES